MRRLARSRQASLASLAVVAPMLLLCACSRSGTDTAKALPCTKYASPDGSDRSPGTRARPVRSVQRLADRLRPGQTGCLRAGTYRGSVELRRPGRVRARIVLRSAAGESARVVGRIVVRRSARYTTIRNLYLDGTNRRQLPSPTVNATGTRFTGNDVTNDHTAICFNLGHPVYGRADGARIDHNRIHDCGVLPATNFDHGIYVSAATRALIESNWIYDNADRGVQLYPDAQDTVVRRNVIYRNGQGVIFGGEGRLASNGNRVEANVIAASRVRLNVESFWPAGPPPNARNVVRSNCVSGGRGRAATGGVAALDGFGASRNLISDPVFVDLANRDLNLVRGSRCWFLVGDVEAGPTGPPPA